MRVGLAVTAMLFVATLGAKAQNECTTPGYQALATAKDSSGTTHQVLCWNPNASGGLLVIPSSLNSVGTAATGTGYSFLAAGTVQAAIMSACSNATPTTPGHVVIPPGTYSGGFNPMSNCTIEGSGMGVTIIEAPSTQNSTMISVTGLTNVILKNFTVDGDCVPWPRTTSACTGNNNIFDLIQVNNSSQILIDGVEVRNVQGNGINLVGGDHYVDVRNSVADYNGQPLPASLIAGFVVNDGGAGGSTHILFFNDTADNGNEGFQLIPPPSSACTGTGTVLNGVLTATTGNCFVQGDIGAAITYNGMVYTILNYGSRTSVTLSSNFTQGTAENYTVAYTITSDIVYESNRSFSNANDGFTIYSNSENGPAQGLRYINNESYCNGWVQGWTNTACQLYNNGTAFGLLQSGSTGSLGDGAGFGFNSPVMSQLQVIGNRAHDNYAEGFDHTPQILAEVGTDDTGYTVCWESGGLFNLSWKAGQAVRINNQIYIISTVDTAKKLTLTSNGLGDNQSNLSFVGVGYTRSTLVGNYAYHNGSGNSSELAGSGFSDISYGSSYSANVAYLNNAAGFIDGTSSLNTHVGDESFDNNQFGASGSEPFGFFANGAFAPSYIGVTTDSSGANNLQSTSVKFNNSTSSAFAESASLCNFGGCNPSATVTDTGAGDAASSGLIRISPECFAANGGTGCINYVGGAGGFTSDLPAQNGTITVH